MTTNDEIIQLRHEHNLSQSQLAKLLGCSKQTVVNWHRKPDAVGYAKCPKHRIDLLKFIINNNIRHKNNQTDAHNG